MKSDDLYSVLGSMEYLHGGSFDDAVNEQRNDRKHMMICTPFVRQYDIMSNRWGDFNVKRSTKQTIYA